MSNNLGRNEVIASQNQKEVTINESDGFLDAAITEVHTVAVTSTNAASVSQSELQRAALVHVTEDGGSTPTNDITITISTAFKRGNFSVLNDTAQNVTVTVTGQTETAPVIPAGDTFMLNLDGADVRSAGGGGGGGGATTFTGLTDTPSAYTGQGSRFVKVNAGETALEFVNETLTAQNWAVPFRGALVSLTGNQTGLTFPLTVGWDVADYDTDGIWSAGSPTRLTVPANVTKVRLRSSVRFENLGAAGTVQAAITWSAGSIQQATLFNRNSSTGSIVNHAFTITPVVEVTPGDYFEVNAAVTMTGQDQILADHFTWFAMEIIETSDAEARPYDIAGFVPGKPGASALVFQYVFDRNADLPASATGSQGYVGVDPAATADFDIQKNGVSVGTMSFAAAANTATFTVASAVSFTPGDRLQVVAPGSQDADLTDLSFTFKMELT